jgi:hypothetical protein
MARYLNCILFAVDLKTFHEKKAPSGQIVTKLFMDGAFLTSLARHQQDKNYFPFTFLVRSLYLALWLIIKFNLQHVLQFNDNIYIYMY